MKRKAVFPGSFDPITNGHCDIILRGIALFDEVIVAVGINSEKKYMFDLEERKKFIEIAFKNESKVKVISFEGLTIDLCRKMKANYLLRGIRNSGDFEFEKAIAQTNAKLSNIETIFMLTNTDTSFISSTIVRDIIRNNGDCSLLVPKSVMLKK